MYCVFRIYTNLSLVFHYNVVYNKQRLLPNLCGEIYELSNGKPYRKNSAIDGGKKTAAFSNIEYGGRGMSLEKDIEHSNTFYLKSDIAVIHKKPTPVQIVNVNYPKRSKAVINEAYFRTPSTTDYNGVYQGYYIDFEAKETKNKTSFPLNNIHDHQVEHMKNAYQQKVLCF